MKYAINIFKHETRYKLYHFDNTHLHENEKSVLISKVFRHRLFMKELEKQDKNITVRQFSKIL
jgi:hypothetical protein